MVKIIDGIEFYEIIGCSKYFISKSGLVYSGKINRLLQAKRRPAGYYAIGLCINSKPSGRYIHRLVAAQFIQNPHNLSDVNHKDMDKSNNSLDNLEWMSHKDNMIHAGKNGRMIGGRANKGKKLAAKTKEKMSIAKIGKKHPKFKGAIHTPFGQFESTYAAAAIEGVTHTAIRNRCKSTAVKFESYYINDK